MEIVLDQRELVEAWPFKNSTVYKVEQPKQPETVKEQHEEHEDALV